MQGRRRQGHHRQRGRIDFKARGRFYHYLRQNGLWTKEVTGFDPATERPSSTRTARCGTSRRYPPTLLVHGTEDTDVPYQLSADMAKELARHKVRTNWSP